MLEKVSAEKQADGSIQVDEGILPIQFETQDKYEKQKIKGGTKLNTDKFQIGQVMTNYLWKELKKSAEVMATLTSLKATGFSMDKLVGTIIERGATDVKSAGAILTSILEQQMNGLQDVKSAENFETFLDTQVLADIGGKPAWENLFMTALQEKEANLLTTKKTGLASKINLIKQRAGIDGGK